MSHIFISYSRDDTQLIDELVNRLHQAGCNVWIDRTGIRVGELYRKRIVEAIADCMCFIIALSSTSVESKNVRKELDLADEHNKTILPIFLEEIGIPSEMKYQLTGLQTIDLATNFDEGFDQLLKSIEKEGGLLQDEPTEIRTTRKRNKGSRTRRPSKRKVSLYDVSLQMAGTDKENVIRLICEVSGITREEAEEFVFKPPRDILLGVTKTVAETAKYKLEAAGARVLMRPRLD